MCIIRIMDQRRGLVIAAGIALLVSLLIVGAIMLINNLIKNRTVSRNVPVSTPTTNTNLPVVSINTPNPSGSNHPTATANPDFKVVNVGGAALNYPKDWALLQCTNSQSVELDPSGGQDATVGCNRATKPVTILVASKLSCPGESVKLGGVTAIRSKDTSGGRTDYRWCVQTTTGWLDISHRTSDKAQAATSQQDYSAEIEDMISRIPQGS
jgi:hypothetical protein